MRHRPAIDRPHRGYAMGAVRNRHYGVPAVDRQVEGYIAMADRYMAVATFRLRRERGQEEAAAHESPSQP